MDENNDGTLTEEEFLKGCLLVIIIKCSYLTFLKCPSYNQSILQPWWQLSSVHISPLKCASYNQSFDFDPSRFRQYPISTRMTSSPKCWLQMCPRSGSWLFNVIKYISCVKSISQAFPSSHPRCSMAPNQLNCHSSRAGGWTSSNAAGCAVFWA